jgi:hypothetical protein
MSIQAEIFIAGNVLLLFLKINLLAELFQQLLKQAPVSLMHS